MDFLKAFTTLGLITATMLSPIDNNTTELNNSELGNTAHSLECGVPQQINILNLMNLYSTLITRINELDVSDVEKIEMSKTITKAVGAVYYGLNVREYNFASFLLYNYLNGGECIEISNYIDSIYPEVWDLIGDGNGLRTSLSRSYPELDLNNYSVKELYVLLMFHSQMPKLDVYNNVTTNSSEIIINDEMLINPQTQLPQIINSLDDGTALNMKVRTRNRLGMFFDHTSIGIEITYALNYVNYVMNITITKNNGSYTLNLNGISITDKYDFDISYEDYIGVAIEPEEVKRIIEYLPFLEKQLKELQDEYGRIFLADNELASLEIYNGIGSPFEIWGELGGFEEMQIPIEFLEVLFNNMRILGD